MARRRRSNGASKHNNLILKHHDLILKPKSVMKNRPVDWAEDDEGELQPIFAPEPLFTPEELEPYRSNRALFDHKRSLRKLVGPSFPFLKLPTELRVEIYRYVLVQTHPIYLVYYKTVGKHPTKLALSLLRTCSAMHDECAQILYGENRFAFWSTYDHLELLRFLNHIGPVNRRWLKTLTMTPPILHEDEPVYSDETRLYGNFGTIAYYRHVCPEFSQQTLSDQRSTWVDLCKSLVTILGNLPRLRELIFTIPPDWYRCRSRGRFTSRYYEDEVAWWYLSELLKFKRSLRVSVTQLVKQNSLSSPDFLKQEKRRKRDLADFKRRLGIWDHRMVLVDDPADCFGFVCPARVEEDPDEYLRDVRDLYVERTF